MANKRSEAEANKADEAKATEANEAYARAYEADAKANEAGKAVVANKPNEAEEQSHCGCQGQSQRGHCG